MCLFVYALVAALLHQFGASQPATETFWKNGEMFFIFELSSDQNFVGAKKMEEICWNEMEWTSYCQPHSSFVCQYISVQRHCRQLQTQRPKVIESEWVKTVIYLRICLRSPTQSSIIIDVDERLRSGRTISVIDRIHSKSDLGLTAVNRIKLDGVDVIN